MSALTELASFANRILKPFDVIVLRRSFYERQLDGEAGDTAEPSGAAPLAGTAGHGAERPEPLVGDTVYLSSNGICLRRELDLERFARFLEINGILFPADFKVSPDKGFHVACRPSSSKGDNAS